MRELEYQRFSPSLQHAAHRCQRGRFVGHVAQAERNSHAIEGIVGKRESFGIQLHERQIAAAALVNQTPASLLEHGAIDIRQHDPSAITNLTRKRGAQVAGATGNIENLMAAPNACLLDREAFP